ncbi:uncharacterized protein LOC130138721 [Syzygium oleosum]|uniref:uncharacterized protein LOC130138721 n=1 Tax=Syzygium oleosum TaxID=219896 RepID=UPI0024B8EFBF|nr:uncharacterized protein LOC130138721 [Syzygium oleosum]
MGARAIENLGVNAGAAAEPRVEARPAEDPRMEAVMRTLEQIGNLYTSWTTAPKEVKELWWNEFKRKFRWDEAEEKEVRRIFKKKADDHMRNVMNRAKRSQEKSDFITADNWTEIKRTWDTEKHKQISEQNKKNRASSSSEGSATYAGGSINIREHRKRMDKYDELVMSTAASGGDGVAASEPSVDSIALWMEASGGMRRGQIFGMGSLSRIYTTQAAVTSSSNAAFLRRTQHEEQMTQELSQLKHLLLQKDEEIRGMKQHLQLILRHLNLDHDDVPPVPPTNPVGDGHNDERHNDNEIADDDDHFVGPC